MTKPKDNPAQFPTTGVSRRQRFRPGKSGLERTPQGDAVTVEEPLEVRFGGETIAITMRTPGNDEQLAVGFLFAEGLIAAADDVVEVSAAEVDDARMCNVIDVIPVERLRPRAGDERLSRRGTLSTAACGVCGRLSINELVELCERQTVAPTLSESVLGGATARLADVQHNFRETGGCHAAVILSAAGDMLAGFEDVGRHNAVDRCVGALVMAGAISRPPDTGVGIPDRPALLTVSGRVSFEIVQKAAVANIPVVAGVSAASSLAIDLAHEVGITLAAFVREGRATVYTHPERVS